ncbi:hypothetical protein Pmani_038100 [Petrolisthes manimaculis]|uniref:Uncharacterized protein n=1 Tax=Petrolisthes manimaculis TaxID=1843537 RepID=A0AAE1NHS0_9EUCA|nr:hypothetical protein Pmani_038100 [Petrolisthes manimaculis]
MVPTVLVLLVVVAVGGAAAADPRCRACHLACIRLPRVDGSCDICSRSLDGSGGSGDLCPALEPCPSNCQMVIDASGCPGCECEETPPPTCPPIACHEGCTEVEDAEGCKECLCEGPGTCPAVPQCLRGCVDKDENSGCFLCNCTHEEEPQPHQSPPSQPNQPSSSQPDQPNTRVSVRPNPYGPPQQSNPGHNFPGSNPHNTDFPDPFAPNFSPARPFSFAFGSSGPFGPNSRFPGQPHPAQQRPPLRPAIPERRRPPTSTFLPPWCPRPRSCSDNCRSSINLLGCQVCMCGPDAYLCPGVPRCRNLCLFLSNRDRCCKCQCPQRNNNNHHHQVTLSVNGVPEPSPLLPFNPFHDLFSEFPPFSQSIPGEFESSGVFVQVGPDSTTHVIHSSSDQGVQTASYPNNYPSTNSYQPSLPGPNPSQPNVPGPNPSQPNGPGPNPSQPNGPGPNSSQPNNQSPDPYQPNGPGPESSQPSGPGPDPYQPNGPGPNPSQPIDAGPNPSQSSVPGPDPYQPSDTVPNPSQPNPNMDPYEPIGQFPDPYQPGESDWDPYQPNPQQNPDPYQPSDQVPSANQPIDASYVPSQTSPLNPSPDQPNTPITGPTDPSPLGTEPDLYSPPETNENAPEKPEHLSSHNLHRNWESRSA